jgi:CheY-like chemotaxis protein
MMKTILVADDKADLIILDLHMPGLDGFGVLQELRSDGIFTGTPVMALTASVMAVGFTGYVTKPIRIGALRDEIQRLLK